jgi:integrase
MKNFVSKLAPIMKEYLKHRKMLGYTDCHENPLAMFDAYCCEHYPEVETPTRETVRNWFDYETKRGYKMYGRVGAIRCFAQYVGNGAYVLPTKAYSRLPRYVPYIFTDDELTSFFAAADSINNNFQRTIKKMMPTLLRLQYTCGLRPYEVRLIKQHNINFDTGEVLVEEAKDNKERIVVMSGDMLQQCRKYDTARAVRNPNSEYFFVRDDEKPITSFQLIKLVQRCWKQANPTVPENMLPRVRPYDLRHRFATTVLHKWICEGKDLYAMLPYLREYMGHEDFSHTAYYIHLLPEHLLNSRGIDWSAIDDVNPEVSIWQRED